MLSFNHCREKLKYWRKEFAKFLKIVIIYSKKFWFVEKSCKIVGKQCDLEKKAARLLKKSCKIVEKSCGL